MAELGLYIGAGVGAGVFVAVALLILFCFIRRRQQKAAENGGTTAMWGTVTRRPSSVAGLDAEEKNFSPKRATSPKRALSPRPFSNAGRDTAVSPSRAQRQHSLTNDKLPLIADDKRPVSSDIAVPRLAVSPREQQGFNPFLTRSNSSVSTGRLNQPNPLAGGEDGIASRPTSTHRPRSRTSSQGSIVSISPQVSCVETPTGVPSIIVNRESAPHVKQFVQRYNQKPQNGEGAVSPTSSSGFTGAEAGAAGGRPARSPSLPSLGTTSVSVVPNIAISGAAGNTSATGPNNSRANKKRSVVLEEGDSAIFAISMMAETTRPVHPDE